MSVRFDEKTLRGQMESMIVEDRVKPEGRPGDDIAMTASVVRLIFICFNGRSTEDFRQAAMSVSLMFEAA